MSWNDSAVFVHARIEKVWARAVAGSGRHFRRVVAQRAAEHVELPRQCVGAAAQRCREIRIEQRPLRHGDVNEIVEAVIEQDLGVEHHDHVDPDEHLEHAFVQIEVDRTGRLLRRPGPIEIGMFAFPPDRQLHLERAVAAAVVVDIIFEGFRLFGQVLDDELAHRPIGALEQGLAGLLEGLAPEPLADLDHPLLAGAAAGDDRHEIAVVHLRHAGIVHDQVEHRLIELAALVELDRRDADAFAEDRGGGGGHAARNGAADVEHMPEHRCEADEVALVKHRHQNHKVVEMADGAGTSVRVVLQNDVAWLELKVLLFEHIGNVGAELPDDHAALGVADHGEFVVLLADDGRHRRTEQHGIHFMTRVAQCVLDQVEGDDIEPPRLARARRRRARGACAGVATR